MYGGVELINIFLFKRCTVRLLDHKGFNSNLKLKNP